MVQLSDFYRGVIVTLHKSGMKTGQILNQLRQKHLIEISDRTICNVMAFFRKRGNWPKQERRGRTPKCTLIKERTLIRVAIRNQWLSLRAIKKGQLRASP